jgi:hypothetical protein
LLSKNINIQIHRTTIFHVVLYGCETWSLTLRDESKPKVFENIVCRRIFVSKKEEVRREWRKLHSEELNDRHTSPNIVRVMKAEKNKMGGPCSMYGGAEVYTGFLVEKVEGNRPLGRPRHIWKYNIKMDFRKWRVEVWTESIWLRIGAAGGGHL